MAQAKSLLLLALVGGMSLVSLRLGQNHLRRILSSAVVSKRRTAEKLEPVGRETMKEVMRQQLVDGALESPRLVGIHDKEGWAGLFSGNAIIEDPVGSPPSGPSSAERSLFYDTFIGPNNVTLNPTRSDIIAVEHRIVVRTVSIDAQFQNGATMRVPVHVVYRFDASMHVKSLMAFWEIIQNQPVLNSYWDILPALVGSSQAFVHMGRVRGLQYTLWYLVGTMLTGAGRGEKAMVHQLCAAIAGKSVAMMSDIFAPDAVLVLPVQNLQFKPSEFISDAVFTRLEVSGLRAGGEFVSFNFAASLNTGESKTGVGVFEFSLQPFGKVKLAELFWE